ncbi:hypothetical protein BDY19DRAFT_1059213 [Irpex rosettiformis]|uniref:Uncharacterized protein n=1 Tax=Irpex rosettiformis TaxID=378272 RepID=A0ACB8TVY6_9APHY|nr:hypothetical protein BDY19DRAFT_1059213 [Irpex rosettiformis]
MSWEFKMLRKRTMPELPPCYAPHKLSEYEMAPPLSLLSDSPEEPALDSDEIGSALTSGTSGSRRKRKADDGATEPNKARRSAPNDNAASGSKATGMHFARSATGVRGSSIKQKAIGRGTKLWHRRNALASKYPTYPAPSRADKEKEDRTVPAAVQSSIYAAERLCSSLTLSHALNAVVINEHIWLTWYERGGCIQSYGLDFINDLPYLMVILVILKYFDDVAWGECREVFSPPQDGKVEFTLGATTFSIDDCSKT